ncbi:MAG TPA: plastocyanin/azurin family copper-binding protein [Thermomicrobiales bacterium]|nr:plastocyanin/azurin family copper-binding protein [Thermomicrobiales bacterium]
MNRLNRRRFLALSSAGAASAVLVACGNEPPTAEELNPTQIPDVAGAPPTLAPITSTPETARGGDSGAEGGEEAGGESADGGEEAGGGGQAAAGGGAEPVSVEGGDLFFEPNEFSVAPGGTITLTNIGMLPHDMSVDEWGGVIIGPLEADQEGEYTVPEDVQPGESFVFYCSIPGHREAGMEGTLTIVEAGAGGEAAAAPAEEEATPEEEAAAASGGEGGGEIEVTVEAGDLFFEPSEFSIVPGGTIVLTNIGMLPHNMAVDEWGGVIIEELDAEGQGEYTVPDDAQPGESFEFYCSVPGHKEAGMVGTLTIAEAGGGGGAAAPAEEEATPEGGAATPMASPVDEAAPEEGGEQAAAAGGGGGGTEVAVEAGDLFFDPTEFEVAPGGTITLSNAGVLPHDMAVDEWDGVIIGPLNGGESGEYTVPEDVQPGETFTFYCSVPGHKEAGMEGTLTIV